jgi:hypothetical protein
MKAFLLERQKSPAFLPAVLLTVAGLTAWSDYCVWDVSAGAGYAGIWMALGGAIVVAGGTPSRRGLALLALLAGASVASVLELSFSNVVSVLALLGLLSAAAFFREWPAGLLRAVEVCWAWAKAPWRWVVLGNEVLASAFERRGGALGGLARAVRLAWVAIPGLILAVLFLLLLGSGNLVLGRELAALMDALWKWLLAFDISFGRLVFWGFIATVALVLVHPSVPAEPGRWWWGVACGWQVPGAVRNGRLRSLIALVLVNAVFLPANTADAVYLWMGRGLPQGITYSDFLHAGVYQLVLATLLAGGVLALVFQQREEVRRDPWVRRLALAWILQNVALLAGVFLRLKLYVEAYQLTEDRIYVAAFLALVLAGYGLLVLRVLERITLMELIGRNMAAVFVFFYIVQFFDTPRWVADYNAAHWLQSGRKEMDLFYLERLGPPAWGALIRIAESEASQNADALGILKREAPGEQAKDWRGVQVWRDGDRRLLRAFLECRAAP